MGRMREAIREHHFTDSILAEESVLVRCDGAQKCTEVFFKAADGAIGLTDVSCEWVTLWREVVGARLGVYSLNGAKANVAAAKKRRDT